MKKVLSFLAAFVLLGAFASSAWAYSFSATAPTGQTLYYNIVSGGVELTYPSGNSNNPYNGYTRPSGALVIPDYVTYGSTTYPVIAIGDYALGSTYITSLVIGDNVTKLELNCIGNCYSLTSVELGSSVTSIGQGAFVSCSSLTSIKLHTSTPPLLHNLAFFSTGSMSNKTFYIPAGSLSAYQSASNWGTSKNYVEPQLDPSINFTVSVNNSTRGTASWTALGDSIVKVIATANTGYHFDHWSNGNTANPDTLALSGDTSVTAYFIGLTVTSSDSTRGSATHTRIGNHQERITATANTGYHFDHWSNGSTTNPDTITLVGDSTVTAYFTTAQYAIIGSAEQSLSYSFDFDDGHDDNLFEFLTDDDNWDNWWTIDNIESDNRALFVTNGEWDDNGYSTNEYINTSSAKVYAYTTVYLLEGDLSYSYDWRGYGESSLDYLRVALLPQNMDVTASGWGQTTVPTGAIALDGGHKLNLQSNWTTQQGTISIPDSGYYKLVFRWRNDYSDGTNPAAAVDNIVMVSTLDPVLGIVVGSDTVDYLDTVTLTAIPNEHYHFTKWNDGDTTNPRQVAATSNINITAYFEPNQYALVTATNDTLRGYASAMGGVSESDYTHLSLSDFTQMTSGTTAPAGDNYFRYVLTTSITGGSQNYCYYKFENADGSMYWHFTPRCTGGNAMGYQSLSSSYSDLFTDTTIGNTITYSGLQGVKITYTNLGWLIEFPVDVHCTQREYNAAYSSVYWAGSVRNGDTTWFDYLSDVPISANANHGYHFDHWSTGSTANPDTITLVGDSTITAYFEPNLYAVVGSTGYSFDFEQSSDDNLFEFLTDDDNGNHWWSIDNIESSNRALFVTNGNWNEYTNNSSAEVYAYTTVYLLEGDLSYSYDWRCNGEHNYDYLRVALLPDTMEANASGWGTTSLPTGAIAMDGGAQLEGHGWSWTTQQGIADIPSSGNYKLVFRWRNDNIAGTNPAAAVDNIVMVSTLDSVRGIVVGSDTVDYLDTVTLTAIPNEHYHFTQWNDGDTTNPRQVVATSNINITAYFELNQYQLTVNVDTSTSPHGAVSGGGSYDYNTSHTITSTASYGYHFDHWSNGSTANPDTITLVSDSTVTAYFAINQYAVVGNTSDSVRGLVEGSDTVDYQDTVTLTAVANYGYHFDHWNDGDTTNPRHIVATYDSNLTAYFELNQYALVTATNDTLRGSSSMGGPITDYAHLSLSDFTQMTSSTTAPAGDNYFRYVLTTSITGGYQTSCYYKFESADGPMYWHFTPCCTGTHAMLYHMGSNSYSDLFTDTTIGNTITYSGLQGVKITYTNLGWLIEFPVDVHCTQRGSNAPYSSVYWAVGSVRNGDTTWYDYLSDVPISATANTGYHFDHWSNGSTANPDTITLVGDSVITAYFIGLTVLSNDNTRGSVSHSKIGDHLEKITATANYGYHFDHWSNGSTANPANITLTSDSTVTAYFERNSYDLTVNVNDATLGTVTTPDGTSALYGDILKAVATPNEHYHVASWQGQGIVATSADKDTVRVSMNSDRSITCNFAIDTHTVAVTSNDIARGSVSATGTEFTYGSPCTVSATAYTGYTFQSWSNGVTANPYTFAVMEDVELTAIFVVPGEETYTVSVSVNDPAMGSATVNGNTTATVTGGSEVTLTATPNAGYHFVQWNDGNTNATRTITVTANATYTATFAANQGIEDVEADGIRIYSADGRIVVEGTDMEVSIYDMMGRQIFNSEIRNSKFETQSSQLPAGVYLVKVGILPAKKVVVVK